MNPRRGSAAGSRRSPAGTRGSGRPGAAAAAGLDVRSVIDRIADAARGREHVARRRSTRVVARSDPCRRLVRRGPQVEPGAAGDRDEVAEHGRRRRRRRRRPDRRTRPARPARRRPRSGCGRRPCPRRAASRAGARSATTAARRRPSSPNAVASSGRMIRPAARASAWSARPTVVMPGEPAGPSAPSGPRRDRRRIEPPAEREPGEDHQLVDRVVALDVGRRVGLRVAQPLRLGEDVGVVERPPRRSSP